MSHRQNSEISRSLSVQVSRLWVLRLLVQVWQWLKLDFVAPCQEKIDKYARRESTQVRWFHFFTVRCKQGREPWVDPLLFDPAAKQEVPCRDWTSAPSLAGRRKNQVRDDGQLWSAEAPPRHWRYNKLTAALHQCDVLQTEHQDVKILFWSNRLFHKFPPKRLWQLEMMMTMLMMSCFGEAC